MTKKVLLSSYMHGNMEALIEYFNKTLKAGYDKEIELVYLDLYEVNKLKRFPRYFKKFIQQLKRYDLIISDYASPLLKAGKRVIFMDHGYGLKSMPGKDEISDSKTIKLGRIIREKTDYIVTLSKRDEEYFYRLPELESFKMPNFIPLGQPRNDVLFDKNFVDFARRDIRDKFKLKDEKLILYAPTWRGYDTDNMFPFDRGDFQRFNDFLEKSGWKMLYRPHYLEDIVTDKLLHGLDNIMRIGVDVEPYTQKILAGVDMVITDYSSIIVDYLIMDKPIAFIPFDLEKYNNFRGIVVDFKSDIETPGPKIEKMDELIDYMSEINNGGDSFKGYRRLSADYYYAYFDNRSCERIWELILDCLNIGHAQKYKIDAAILE
jgi:CDP-glycerol glycerophosphotransferase (TagB/SpsB family)